MLKLNVNVRELGRIALPVYLENLTDDRDPEMVHRLLARRIHEEQIHVQTDPPQDSGKIMRELADRTFDEINDFAWEYAC